MKIAVRNIGPIEILAVIDNEYDNPHYEFSLNKNMLILGRSGSGKTALALTLHFLPFIILYCLIKSGNIINILDKYFHIYCKRDFKNHKETSQIDLILPISDVLSTEEIESITNLPYDHALQKYPRVRIRLKYIAQSIEESAEDIWKADVSLETAEKNERYKDF